jgi:hypothetical protein
VCRLLRFLLHSTVAFFSVLTVLLIYNQCFDFFQTMPATPKSATPKATAPKATAPKAARHPKATLKAKAISKAKKGKGGGRKASAQNFNDEDKEFLITLLEEIHPIGPEMWNQVVSRYNDEYAEPNQRTTRDKDGPRTQYYKMYKTAKPTGDPTCPEYVRRAKKLKREIEDEVAMTGIDDDDSELAASDVEADEEPEHEPASEANNADDVEDNTENNAIEDNSESNAAENDNDDDDEYDGTDRTVAIAIESDDVAAEPESAKKPEAKAVKMTKGTGSIAAAPV